MYQHLEGAYIAEGHATSIPPFFNGIHYSHWKARMKIFIQATDYPSWDVIMNGPKIPKKSVDGKQVENLSSEWNEEDINLIQTNARAINILYCAVSGQEYDKIFGCDTAKQMWDKLEVTHEGTSCKVKETKINMLVHDYELFMMKEDESIDDMFDRFSKIVGDLKALERPYSDRDQRYEREDKKRNVAFKSSSSLEKLEEDDDEDGELDEQDFAFFTRKMKSYARRKKQLWKQHHS
ncbi:DUF4219 domain-containing protein/UBN2 domain-containing protein [Senna tora]|uniref:DUF4219 domain-containing protein/UBN2 domain-containing protein n=1 Tax=Senna tora TaxID=362788 RepID=A0A834WVK5_9FABA|nr:DUF4219 domain-containing protein/UBN2 domain-containing protein [Senna tora]